MDFDYIDIHGHLNFAAFDVDRNQVLERMRLAKVAVINVGTKAETSKSAINLAEEHEDMYATIGLHPIHTEASHHDAYELGGEKQDASSSPPEEINKEMYLDFAKHPKVVAIGECGLDYYRVSPSTKDKQLEAFDTMIDIANKSNKPLMLHVRNGKEDQGAYKEAVKILKEKAKVKANFHFFAGTISDLRAIMDIDATVSFTGVLTFTQDYDSLVKFVPLERIMSETDCPYVAPAPYRGKRNEPTYVIEIVKAIARIRKEDDVMVSKQLVENAKNFFNLE